MAKKTTDITKVGNNVPAIPDYMSDAPTGMDELKHFVIPPRMKIVQKQAGEKLLEQFGVGDVILTPHMIAVREMGRNPKGQPTGDIEPFLVVPLFFYPEWCTWNPISSRGQLPSIRERSCDPTSVLARKSRDSKLRYEKHPDLDGEATMRHVEHLNFVVYLIDHELGGQPIVMSFSRGEHGTGQRWASLIRARKAPIYGGVYTMGVSMRPGAKGDWWGFDPGNPDPTIHAPWVDKDSFDALRQAHEELAELHKGQLLRADYSDEDAGEADPAAVGSSEM